MTAHYPNDMKLTEVAKLDDADFDRFRSWLLASARVDQSGEATRMSVKISTVGDIAKIPPSRAAAFVKDLESWRMTWRNLQGPDDENALEEIFRKQIVPLVPPETSIEEARKHFFEMKDKILSAMKEVINDLNWLDNGGTDAHVRVRIADTEGRVVCDHRSTMRM